MGIWDWVGAGFADRDLRVSWLQVAALEVHLTLRRGRKVGDKVGEKGLSGELAERWNRALGQ